MLPRDIKEYLKSLSLFFPFRPYLAKSLKVYEMAIVEKMMEWNRQEGNGMSDYIQLKE